MKVAGAQSLEGKRTMCSFEFTLVSLVNLKSKPSEWETWLLDDYREYHEVKYQLENDSSMPGFLIVSRIGMFIKD